MKTKQVFTEEFLTELTEALVSKNKREIEDLKKVVTYSLDIAIYMCLRHIELFGIAEQHDPKKDPTP